MDQSMDRRDFLRTGGAGAFGLAVFHPFRIYLSPSFDIVLKNGKVINGTGQKAWKADIGIKGNKITGIGDISPEQGKEVVDVSGCYVSPGFIDIHTHSDYSVLNYPKAESRVYQGITTEVTGNCGDSAAPLRGVNAEKRRKEWLEEEEIEADWTDVASYFSRLESTTISVNHAMLLGHGTLRKNATGNVNRTLTAEEMKKIHQALNEGMDQGAFGISTGLEYTPGQYSPTQEIISLAQIVARRNGLYASHIRNEESQLLAAIHEALEIGRQTGVRVEISHLKAAGRPNWSKQKAALHLIESARRNGVKAYADAYTYTAYSTGITIFLKPWVREGGSEAILNRLQDPQKRKRIRKEIEESVQQDPGSYKLIVISEVHTDKNRNLVGKSIEEIGSLWNIEPVDAVLRLIEEEKTKVSFIGHGMSPENVEMVLSHPLVMIGSDGYCMAPYGKALQSQPHPRSYGAFARVISHYMRERELFELPTAVKKMTSMAADQAGIHDRGRIARGKKADIAVFDVDTVKDNATFKKPHQLASGFKYVLVNGAFVVKDGKHTGAKPGSVLRKS